MKYRSRDSVFAGKAMGVAIGTIAILAGWRSFAAPLAVILLCVISIVIYRLVRAVRSELGSARRDAAKDRGSQLR